MQGTEQLLDKDLRSLKHQSMMTAASVAAATAAPENSAAISLNNSTAHQVCLSVMAAAVAAALTAMGAATKQCAPNVACSTHCC